MVKVQLTFTESTELAMKGGEICMEGEQHFKWGDGSRAPVTGLDTVCEKPQRSDL